MALRWETDEFGGSGYSGGVRVACYDAGIRFKEYRLRWTLLTSFDRHVEGGADTPEAARAAAEAAWGEWCQTARLAPAGEAERLDGALTRLVREMLRDRARPGVDAVLSQGTRDAHVAAWELLCECPEPPPADAP